MDSIDYKQGEKIALACIAGNIVLSMFKLLAGIIGNSKGMVADAIHSVSDIITTVVVFIGVKIAKKPADKEHPYGHGKVEPIAAALVGLSLVFTALVIVMKIIESILTHSFVTPSFIALAAAILSIFIKEVMYRITYRVGKKINSQSIMADAWHHRSDAFSSIGTFCGILGSMAGKWLKIHFLEYLDPIAGIVVAGMIFKVAYDIIRHTINGLMDAAPDIEKITYIRQIVGLIDGVISVPWIKARYIGRHLFTDMEIMVDAKITVESGHNIAECVKKSVLENVNDVYEVLVHIEPVKDLDERPLNTSNNRN